MNKIITRGAAVAMLCLAGSANATFTSVSNQFLTDPSAWSATPGTTNIFGSNLVQYSGGLTPNAANNELVMEADGITPVNYFVPGGTSILAGNGQVSNQVNPSDPLTPVTQVTLFGNNAGPIIDSGIPDFTQPPNTIQYTHTDFLMQNNSGFDFTVQFAWLLDTDVDASAGFFSFETNPFGPTVGNPLDVLTTQLNTLGNSGISTFDVAAGGVLGFSLLTDILFADSFNNTIASIYDISIIDQRVPVPEPGSLLLLAAGLVGLGVSRRKGKTS